MLLGIEIGGTKLQMAVGNGQDRSLSGQADEFVHRERGASAILEWIERSAQPLLKEFSPTRVGIGFGGPVDSTHGRVVTSHHVEGWRDFDLGEWCRSRLGLPMALGNDADLAGLAEARLGAGRNCDPVFYITVGTGIGGGLIVAGRPYQGHGLAAAEIGHLRPGLDAETPHDILESHAAGWGIAARAQACLHSPDPAQAADCANLRTYCANRVDQLTARHVADAASKGNRLALDVMSHATRALGWGIAQMITLLSPAVVVMGGGVADAHADVFLNPLRGVVDRYVFPPLRGSFQVLKAELGKWVVVHGALAHARDQESAA